MEKMNISIKKISILVSFLFIVCFTDQNSADEKEIATHRVECGLNTDHIQCVDEKQNIFNNFSEIPETTNVLILRNEIDHKVFHIPTLKNLVNITELELRELRPGNNLLSQDFLQNMQNLESLTINIECFHKTDLSNNSLLLPKLKILILKSYSHNDLPDDFFCSFPGLEKLIIGPRILSDLLHLPCGLNNTSCCFQLQWIEIESNDLSSHSAPRVALEAFRNLPNLEVLYINSWMLTLPSNLLVADFPKLTSVQLFVNYAKIDFLIQLRSLTRLRVLGSLNYMSRSLDFEFRNLAQLTVLDLKRSHIERISWRSFKNCSNLTLLDLSHNFISVLAETNESENVTNVFTTDGLPSLKYLNLAYNRIEYLDYSFIPKTVKVLDISFNPLSSISGNETSCRNHALKEFHASCALLRNLEQICFPPFLEVISLKRSRISRLSEKTFSSLNNLKELLLDGNYLLNVDQFAFSSVNKYIVPLPHSNTQDFECFPCKRFHKPIRNVSIMPVMNDQSHHTCQYMKTCDYPVVEYETIPRSYCSSLMLKEFPFVLPEDSTRIYLDGSNLTTVDLDLILQQYSHVNALYLNLSNVHQIEMTDDSVITSLQELHLEDNFLEVLPRNFFSKLKNLSSLHLQRNSLKHFEILTYEPLSLDELHLENNSVSEFAVENQFKFEYRINSVYLQFNEFSKINASFCDYKIAILHLENNKISDLIFNCERLKNYPLEQLYLQNNHLTVLNSSTFNNLPSLQELNLEKNRIQQIKNKAFSRLPGLKRLNLRRNEIEEIDEGMFYEVNNLEVLNLDENSLVEIPPLVFKDLEKLQTLYLNRNRIITLSLDLFKNNEELMEIHLEENNIERIDLSVFRHLHSLVSLYLNNNNISEIKSLLSVHLLSLEELHLNENQLKILNAEEFKGLKYMAKLFLHHNEIHHVDKDTFKDLNSLEILTLHENKLGQLEIWNFGLSPTLKNLTIYQNPWSCECQYLKGLRSFLSENDFISNRSEIKCFSIENKMFRINQFDDFFNKFCQNNTLTIGLSVSIGFLLLIVFISVLLFKYRLAIQVMFYSRFKVRFCYDEMMDEGKRYHAFVAYSYDDRGFVADELVPRLEDYRLCIHDRDFVVGLFIQENIINAVNNSSCTLMVVSNSFVKSGWCMYEFRTAYERTLKDRWRRILVILIEDINPDDLEDEMEFYLNTTTYLRWGDKLFWEKLYFALPSLTDNDRERNHRQQNIPFQQLNR